MKQRPSLETNSRSSDQEIPFSWNTVYHYRVNKSRQMFLFCTKNKHTVYIKNEQTVTKKVARGYFMGTELETNLTYVHSIVKIRFIYRKSRGSSGRIVTEYGLGDWGSIPDRGRGFFF
jgi:hypothetical protein